MFDPINKPQHYNSFIGVEVIDVTREMNFTTGNIVKYICRAPYKGRYVEDLNKARAYAKFLIEFDATPSPEIEIYRQLEPRFKKPYLLALLADKDPSFALALIDELNSGLFS